MATRGRAFRANVNRGRYSASDQGARATLGRQLNSDMRGIMNNLSAFIRHVGDVSPAILQGALEPTLDKAKVYCPKDSGTLANSGYVTTRRSGGEAQVEIGFGKGGEPHYAVFVHEMPMRHVAPTRAKFLQAALEEDEKDIEARIVEGYRGIIGGSS